MRRSLAPSFGAILLMTATSSWARLDNLIINYPGGTPKLFAFRPRPQRETPLPRPPAKERFRPRRKVNQALREHLQYPAQPVHHHPPTNLPDQVSDVAGTPHTHQPVQSDLIASKITQKNGQKGRHSSCQPHPSSADPLQACTPSRLLTAELGRGREGQAGQFVALLSNFCSCNREVICHSPFLSVILG